LDDESAAHFEKVQTYLRAMNIEYSINPRLVRGLDYYTHTAFEFKAAGIGSIDTIGGGGRYNGLVSQIGGQQQPGVGFGLGLERLLLVLEKQAVNLPEEAKPDVYFVALGTEAEDRIVPLLNEARASGLIAEKDYGGRKLKAQLKSADRLSAAYAAILGDDELSRGEIVLKELATGEQETVALDELVGLLLQRKKKS
jgi:histidyl-tRNA synthetase